MSKVAVINRTNFKNYGSVLQCYALCNAVRDLGYDSEIIWESGNLSKNFDFRPNKLVSSLFKLMTHPKLIASTVKGVNSIGARVITDGTVALFDEFVAGEIRQKKLPHKELVRLAKSDEYKKFVCGSDQIWCSTTLYVDPLMYLRFAPKHKRVAYAPSIGRNYIPSYNRRQMKKYINDIPSLSIRETEGQGLIRELTGREAPIVLDPTLLYDKSHWDKLKAKVETGEKYMLCYFLDTPKERVQKRLAEVSKERGLRIIALVSKLDVCEAEDASVIYPDCGPREFLSYVENAELTVTDSYHGMLFSITYGKDFWSVEREYGEFDQSSRQKTVLRMLSLENRYLLPDGDLSFSAEPIDHAAVKKIIEQRRKESLDHLKKSLAD